MRVPYTNEEIRIERARRSLLHFTEYTKSDYQTNWHHKALCNILDRFVAGEIKRLMVFQPPRTGKLLSSLTKLYTTNGWVSHGDLKVGDFVYHPSGKAIKVLAVSEKGIANVEMGFTNGQVIRCHENHEWTIFDRANQTYRTVETNFFLDADLGESRALYQIPFGVKLGIAFVKRLSSSEYEAGECIQVDSPDGLYLVGERLIPTHNSELVSRRLPAYILGVNPDAQVIACSYAADLATRMNRDVQRIIVDPAYERLFPNTKIGGKNIRTMADGSWLRNSEIFEVIGKRGVYRASGVGGGITGMGSNYAIIDDPIKNQEEAYSITYQERLYDWYVSTLYTRLEKGGSVLLTVTRWHERDLAGRLLEESSKDPDADKWHILCLPNIKEDFGNYYGRYLKNGNVLFDVDDRLEGEALWPEKFSLDACRQMKATVGTKVWNALHQQRPSSEAGDLFKREWWRFYRVVPQQLDYVIISVDSTFKKSDTSDYVAIHVWAKSGGKRYLLDRVHGRMGFLETLNACIRIYKKFPYANELLIEDKANGEAIIDTLSEKIPIVIPFTPKESKQARAMSIAPQVESGATYLPEDEYWLSDFIEQFASFPLGKHDDDVDAMSQTFIRFGKNTFDWVDEFVEISSKQSTQPNNIKSMFGWG